MAQYYLGFMYYYGRGIQQNFSMALHWLQKAAKQNVNDAHYYLGLLHEQGNAVTKNLEEAKKSYQLASRSGNQRAKKRLKQLQETINYIQTQQKPIQPIVQSQHLPKALIPKPTYLCLNTKITPISQKIVKRKL